MIIDLETTGLDTLCNEVRLHGHSIVSQPDSEQHTVDNIIARDILVQAGGPVLFVPYIFKEAFRPKRIGICWDGSRLAARALRDAHPILVQADALFALSVDAAETTPAEASLDKLDKYLSRYPQPAELVDMPGSGINIQPFPRPCRSRRITRTPRQLHRTKRPDNPAPSCLRAGSPRGADSA